jgi:phage terminase large subunit
MSYSQDVELLKRLEKADRERVSPRLEAFRKPARIKGCHGGRGAGAKSWSIASLLIQAASVRPLDIACLREVQLTLEESVWKLLKETIERLKYPGWIVTKEAINNVNGSHIIFRGISDLRADQLKSLEGFDIFWIEEAQSITQHSLDVLMPTIRKQGSELWFSMNREKDVDPIIARLWNTNRNDAVLIALEPGAKDNPWWTKELQTEMDNDFARDPELALHIWHGLPRNQDPQSIFSRSDIRAAMDRRLDVADNAPIVLGVDVARFGDDKTTIYKRKGMKIVDYKKLKKADTQKVARIVWDMAGRDFSVPINVDDSGVGGGVTDKLRDLGANAIPVLNGDPAWDDDRFTTCADEQWFNFPINEAEIPDDPELMEELSGRVYFYTPKDQKKIEPKKDYKKRHGASPDSADGLLLCYYVAKVGRVGDYGAGELGL